MGTGFSGLGMAVRLVQRAERDFVVLERADGVGGTWRDNTYPGAACDIRSDLYSFSFAPNPNWSRRYSPQGEILEYLRGIAQQFDLTSSIRFGSELTDARWDEERQLWTLTTSTGVLTADVLVAGHGPLIEPVMPDIPGIDSFEGELLHSARWRDDVDLAGARVGVIGTGASAIQLVPQLQAIAACLTVFQRTAAWITPRGDRPTSERRRRVFERLPALQRLARWSVFRSNEARFLGFRSAAVGTLFARVTRTFLAKTVSDPVLRDKLTPHYRIGCKRVLISSDFYPAMTRPNVELVTDAIARIEGNAVVTATGERHELDALVCATGFNATRPPLARVLFGREGISLDEVWKPSAGALHGTAIAGFPNLFFLAGPNTGLGHNSMVYIIEAQQNYALAAIDLLRSRGGGSIEPTPQAQARYNERLQAKFGGTTWSTGGCTSYYVDETGRNTALWPRSASAFRRSIRSLDETEYSLQPARLAR